MNSLYLLFSFWPLTLHFILNSINFWLEFCVGFYQNLSTWLLFLPFYFSVKLNGTDAAAAWHQKLNTHTHVNLFVLLFLFFLHLLFSFALYPFSFHKLSTLSHFTTLSSLPVQMSACTLYFIFLSFAFLFNPYVHSQLAKTHFSVLEHCFLYNNSS